MTKFEKDMAYALDVDWMPVLQKRSAELDRLRREGRRCKNGFRCLCIAQELAQLEREYEAIAESAC